MTNINDIAKMAKVSPSTVSRVINNHPYVSDEKRAAVRQAIEETNYQVNINAVHLSKGKTFLVGVLLPYANHPYFGQLIDGIARKAMENNYNLLLFQTKYELDKEKEALNMLKLKQIDALIICSRASDLTMINDYTSYGKIVLFEHVKNTKISSTYIDHYKTFTIALKYLYEKGHEKIGYCIGRRTGPNSKQRELAYRDFLKKINRPFISDYIIDNSLHLEDGEYVMNRMQKMANPPSALLVTSDQVAAGILAYCDNKEISVPNELALIGFDNQPISKSLGITTIEMNLVEVGERLFLQSIDNKTFSSVEIPSKLIERRTV